MEKLSVRIILWCVVGVLTAMLMWRGPDKLIARVPPVQVAEDGSLGESIFEANCVQCHGKDGNGNGPAAVFLNPRPRDFTAGKFKFRST